MRNRVGESRFYYSYAAFEAVMSGWLFYVGDTWQAIGTLVFVPIIISFIGFLKRRERLGWLLGRSEMRIAFYEAHLAGLSISDWLRQETDRDDLVWNDLLRKRNKQGDTV